MSVGQDLIVTGPFLQQRSAGNVLVQPTGQPATSSVKLGDMAAATGGGTRNANGFPTAGNIIALSSVKLASGVPLTASASGTNFGLTFAAATGASVVSPAANNSTIAPVAALEIILPSNYVAGKNLTLTINQAITIGSGTVTTKTLTAAAYLQGSDGTSGSNLIATAAQTLTNANTALVFTITGTTLSAGSRVLVLLTGALTETASSNVTFAITKISLS